MRYRDYQSVQRFTLGVSLPFMTKTTVCCKRCEDFRLFSWPFEAPADVLMQFWFITFCILLFLFVETTRMWLHCVLMPHKLTVSLAIPASCSALWLQLELASFVRVGLF